jgi:hypothetical protein
MTNSAKVSRFYAPTDDLPKVEKENFFYYKIPDRVYVVDSDPNVDEYELLKVKEREIKELNNRLPLQIKSIDNAVPTFEVISFNETTKEFCIFVKETCYLGITLSSEEDFAPENFFIKEKDEYIYSFAYVKNSLDTKLQGIKIFPEKHQMFIDPVSPGIHYVSFDLLESSQLDTFDIELYSNNSTSTPDKFLYYDNYIDENQNILSYMTISNDRLEVVRKDWQGLSGTLDKSMLLESYQMLDEENQSFYADSFVRQNMLLYAKSEDSPTKLYCYSLFQEGASYIYTNNDKYLYDVLCDRIDYQIDDEINIETRKNAILPGEKILSIRLKVENYESLETPGYSAYYINSAGEVVDEDKAWRDLDGQQKKWKYQIENIGSYKFTAEIKYKSFKIESAGEKIILVNYKSPYKVFDLDADYTGWQLGITPDNRIELKNPETNGRKIINFYKDGYFFVESTGEIFTNENFDSLRLEYDA